jgi:hypothetical protein
MDLLIWLGPAALSGAALIISMLMVGRRVDLLGEYSVELRRLNFAVQASQEEVSRILEVLTPLSSTLPRLADVNLHLCQLKRQQNGIIEKLNHLSPALRSVQELRVLVDGLDGKAARSIEKLSAVSETLADWTTRLDAADAELKNLFALEAIKSLLNETDLDRTPEVMGR